MYWFCSESACTTDIVGTLLGSAAIPTGSLVAGAPFTVTLVTSAGDVMGFATVIVSVATRRLIETAEASRDVPAAHDGVPRGLQAKGINVRILRSRSASRV